MTEEALCPACAHPRGKPRGQPWFIKVFKMKPLPAACRVMDDGLNPSGWPEECGCVSPFHGS